jgi:hypothetical protein
MLSSSNHALFFCTALLSVVVAGATVTTTVARADLPPPSGTKYVGFEFTVTELAAAPGYVMLAYPTSESNGAPTFELSVVEDGTPVRLGRRSSMPRLYLMEKTAFETWRAAHLAPTTRWDPDQAAAELVKGPSVVACDAVIRQEYVLSTSRPENVIQQTFALVEGNSKACLTREVSRTDTDPSGAESARDAGDADAASQAPRSPTEGTSQAGPKVDEQRTASDHGCTLADATATGSSLLLAAFGILLMRRRRRESDGDGASP